MLDMKEKRQQRERDQNMGSGPELSLLCFDHYDSHCVPSEWEWHTSTSDRSFGTETSQTCSPEPELVQKDGHFGVLS